MAKKIKMLRLHIDPFLHNLELLVGLEKNLYIATRDILLLQQSKMGELFRRGVVGGINPSNSEATFIQSRRTQRFLKII